MKEHIDSEIKFIKILHSLSKVPTWQWKALWDSILHLATPLCSVYQQTHPLELESRNSHSTDVGKTEL